MQGSEEPDGCTARRRGQEIAPPAEWAHQNHPPSNRQLRRASGRVVLPSNFYQPGLTSSCSPQPQHAPLPPSRQTFRTFPPPTCLGGGRGSMVWTQPVILAPPPDGGWLPAQWLCLLYSRKVSGELELQRKTSPVSRASMLRWPLPLHEASRVTTCIGDRKKPGRERGTLST